MLGSTLSTIRKALRAELGVEVNPSYYDSKQDDLYDTVIGRVYRQMWQEHDWPHLRIERVVSIGTGDQYTIFDTDLDFERINQAWVRRGATASIDQAYWYPLRYGISPAHYNTRSAPTESYRPFNWQHFNGPIPGIGPDKGFELWPVTTFTGSEQIDVQFYGQKVLDNAYPTSDATVFEIDDDLIVLLAAAELLARKNADDSADKRAAAARILRRLRGQQNKSEPFVLGGGDSASHVRDGRFIWSPDAY